MMKKLFFVETNGYNMVVSVDNENNCKYLTETEEFPSLVYDFAEEKKEKAEEFLNTIEDDSMWEDDCTYEELLEDPQFEILAEIEKEF